MYRLLKRAFRRAGYDLVRIEDTSSAPSAPEAVAVETPAAAVDIWATPDFDDFHWKVIERVKPYTITSEQRIHALVESVRYLVRNRIEGAIVECGVYKGGSMMAAALTLLEEGVEDRELYLFDTFEGMPAPSPRDVNLWGEPALETFAKARITDTSSIWVNSPLEEVQAALNTTGYPGERMHYVKGLVEETIPERAPECIALLRLDTDFYQSTRHELQHLYSRLVPNGILIIDDYGHFSGAREAADEFFQAMSPVPFFHRIDYTGRLILKR